ncbi:MAG: ferritin [Crenarchaeota archaeon]|nr:MAG: ferritin [Thermoproteota archaeon]RDJ33087.1 MAG: ferritin [Thermoproteota archaeon]RDJ36409.1 MAG: ferritin [Thermoproteota archaeon]RDJ39038.1 MAG: ferritin [Thermoproteota archaeon]
MKLSDEMRKSLNEQIVMESDASSFYLAMASWCEVTGYEGAASFFYAQSDEERQHMLKIVHYMNRIGTMADISACSEPKKDVKSLEEIIKTSLENEQKVTQSIHQIITLAEKERDRRTFDFMQWFVKEQIEEEETFDNILQKFEVVGRDKLAIYEVDKYMNGIGSKQDKE